MLGIAKDRNRSEGLTFYWQHYGLKKDPFSLIPESSMFVNLPKFEHHMDLLLYLIRNENALLAIIGDKGCGKTSFMNHLTSQIDDAMHMQHIAADSLMTPEKLLQKICKGFAIDYQPSLNKEENLDNTIAKIQHKEKTCLLTIDDSHFLPLESLQILLHLIREQSETQMRLHIILLGDHNLQSKLSNLVKHDLSGNMIHAIELEPLTLDETKQYLRYRFNQASPTKHFPFTDGEVERIHAVSKGVPEQINIQAQQSLLNELNRRQPVVKKQSAWQRYQTQVLGGSLIAAILMIIALLMTHSRVEQPKNIMANHTEPSISFENSSANVQAQTSATPKNESSQTMSTEMNRLEEKTSEQMSAVTDENKELVLNMMNSNKNENTVTAPISPAQSSPAPQTTARNYNDDFIAIDKNHSITLKVKENTEEHVMVPPQNTSPVPSVNNAAPQTMSLNSPTTNDDAPAATQPAVAEKPAIAPKQTSAILSKSYTVQIIGLSDENAIRSFIKQNRLESQAHYFQTKLGDKPFYLLVYGEFASEKDAMNARKNLPQALMQYHPWVRVLNDMGNRMKMVG